MPTIKPVTELQRNSASLVKEAMETKQPIYLTRNGNAAVVLIDAAEFDAIMNDGHSLGKEFQRLKRDYFDLVDRFSDYQFKHGDYYTLEEVEQQLSEKWGEDAF